MVNSLHRSFKVLASKPPAATSDVQTLTAFFRHVPQEYLGVVSQVTELELQHDSGKYIRVWGPLGCIEMDQGYEISRHISDSMPIGDDGGGKALIYMHGKSGFGLYSVGFGALDKSEAVFVAPSLLALLELGVGIENISRNA